MTQIEKILIARDGCTKEQAKETLEHTKRCVNEALETGDYDSVEDIMASELGLEMDYIFDVI